MKMKMMIQNADNSSFFEVLLLFFDMAGLDIARNVTCVFILERKQSHKLEFCNFFQNYDKKNI
jgi:hypothetical protein